LIREDLGEEKSAAPLILSYSSIKLTRGPRLQALSDTIRFFATVEGGSSILHLSESHGNER